MRRPARRWGTAAALAVLVTGAGCSGDDGDAVERLTDDLVEETDGALTREAARCVAERLDEDYGDDAFRLVLEAAEDEGDDPDAVRVAVIDIFAECDALDAVLLDD